MNGDEKPIVWLKTEVKTPPFSLDARKVQGPIQTVRPSISMKAAKQKKLEKAGWTVGTTADFLELEPAEEVVITMKLALASKLKALRRQSQLTQAQLAKQIGSSQSRIARMETADKSVSLELFVRSLASLGATQSQIGEVMATKSPSPNASPDKKAVKPKKARTAE